jgi:hypothetical protein
VSGISDPLECQKYIKIKFKNMSIEQQHAVKKEVPSLIFEMD